MAVNKASTRAAFILLTSLFFMWGFVHNLDPILIPHLKKSFSLSTLQASLVDSSVFIAYFLMALPAGILLKKYGYKTGIIIGLIFFAIGSFLFIPAANTQAYGFFLAALFVIGCGLALLETAANPYAALLGSADTASQRLNFAQAFNGAVSDISTVVWDTGSSQNLVTGSDSIIRIKNPGAKQNLQYSISVFSDYSDFEVRFRETWNNKSAYATGGIVVYDNNYYESTSSISLNPYSANLPPGVSDDWTPYYPFSYSGYVNIGGVDASQISYVQNFVGGTDTTKNRVVFSQDESGNVVPGNWIQVESGKGITGGMSMISSVSKFVDKPVYDNDPLSTTGTVTGFK